jgi:hypothetical protein
MSLDTFLKEKVEMAGSPKLRIKKYFGSATIQETVLDLEEAKNFLDYFWTKDGGTNIVVSIEGRTIKSYADLVATASQDRYKKNAFVDVGLFLSNDGQKSIWPGQK